MKIGVCFTDPMSSPIMFKHQRYFVASLQSL